MLQSFGGLQFDFIESSKPTLKIIILLHGRKQSRTEFTTKYHKLITSINTDFHIVILEQRNHGDRLIDSMQNESIKANPNHPLDMYAIQLGTMADIKFIIEMLPIYHKKFYKFGLVGFSLGGHVALLAGWMEKVEVVVSICGSSNYFELMESRNVELRQFPGLLSIVKLYDPINNLQKYVEKHLLLLGGGLDRLVPTKTNASFVVDLYELQRQLPIDKRGTVIRKVDQKAKHEVSEFMISECVLFLKDKFNIRFNTLEED
jgi:pimeloyl-ACP methyl ester carboxylesterase